jgi:hypothetical protein
MTVYDRSDAITELFSSITVSKSGTLFLFVARWTLTTMALRSNGRPEPEVILNVRPLCF